MIKEEKGSNKIKVFPLVGNNRSGSFEVSLPNSLSFDVCISVHELRVALGSRYDHVHPYSHGLCRGGHHVV